MNDKSKTSVATLEKELAEIGRQKTAAEERMQELERELMEERDGRLEKATRAAATVVEKDAIIEDLKKQVKTVAAKAMNSAQAKLYREYLSSDHSKWDEEEMRDVIAMDDELNALEPSGAEQAVEKVSGGDTDMVEKAADPSQDAPVSNESAQDPPPPQV